MNEYPDLTERQALEALAILDDLVDLCERNNDPNDWIGEIRSAYDFLRKLGLR